MLIPQWGPQYKATTDISRGRGPHLHWQQLIMPSNEGLTEEPHLSYNPKQPVNFVLHVKLSLAGQTYRPKRTPPKAERSLSISRLEQQSMIACVCRCHCQNQGAPPARPTCEDNTKRLCPPKFRMSATMDQTIGYSPTLAWPFSLPAVGCAKLWHRGVDSTPAPGFIIYCLVMLHIIRSDDNVWSMVSRGMS